MRKKFQKGLDRPRALCYNDLTMGVMSQKGEVDVRTKDEQLFAVIMNFIDSYTEENGCSPTVREISESTDISRSTVQRYL